jgi:hypothetical protein
MEVYFKKRYERKKNESLRLSFSISVIVDGDGNRQEDCVVICYS